MAWKERSQTVSDHTVGIVDTIESYLPANDEGCFMMDRLKRLQKKMIRTGSSVVNKSGVNQIGKILCLYPLIVLRKYQYFGTTRWLKQRCVPP